MFNSSRIPVPTSLLACLLVAAAAPMAQASGFQLREQSPSAQGNAFAGASAKAEDPSTTFFNPATLTDLPGFQLALGSSYVAPVAEFGNGIGTRAPIFPQAQRIISGPGSEPNSADAVALPVLSASWNLGKVALGFSVNAPFGMATNYGEEFVGRYHARKSDLAIVDLAPSVAWKINPEWSVGASFLARKATATLSNDMDFGTIATDAGFPSPAPGAADGLATLKGDRWGYGYRLGLTFQPTSSLHLGLGYQAPVNMTLKGTIHFDGVPTVLSTVFTDGDASAEMNLPATTSLGADWIYSESLSFQGEVARTDWSCFKELRVKLGGSKPDSVTEENWRNTWFSSLGLRWKLNSEATFRAGLALDQGAASDAYRTPRIPDNDRTWLSTGLGYRLNKSTVLDLGYTHIFVKDAAIGLASGTERTSPNFYRGNLSGNFKMHIDILAVQAHISF